VGGSAESELIVAGYALIATAEMQWSTNCGWNFSPTADVARHERTAHGDALCVDRWMPVK